jgi:uncharacterized repeat protein (TIGR03843 family)
MPLSDDDAIDLLKRGTIELEGRLVDASNTTLRAVITCDGVEARCVYKPVAGERPLWDFPDGTLAGRELAAYLVSQATGWQLVPPTVLRDGPLGVGMCQLWIDDERLADEELLGFVPVRRVPAGWHRVVSARDDRGRPFVLAHSDDPRLARMAIFDAVANNADRKGGHIIPTVEGQLYGVDHGICFHLDEKLRTILWGWAGAPLPPDTLEVLEKLRADTEAGLGAALAEHITDVEIATFAGRIDQLLATRRFPEVPEHRHAIPWPPV